MSQFRVKTDIHIDQRAFEARQLSAHATAHTVGKAFAVDPSATGFLDKGLAMASAAVDTVLGTSQAIKRLMTHAPDTLRAAGEVMQAGIYNSLPLHWRLMGQPPVVEALSKKTNRLSEGVTGRIAQLKRADANAQRMIKATVFEPMAATKDAFTHNTWATAGDAYRGTAAFLSLAPLAITRTPVGVPAASVMNSATPVATAPKLPHGNVIDVTAVRVDGAKPPPSPGQQAMGRVAVVRHSGDQGLAAPGRLASKPGEHRMTGQSATAASATAAQPAQSGQAHLELRAGLAQRGYTLDGFNVPANFQQRDAHYMATLLAAPEPFLAALSLDGAPRYGRGHAFQILANTQNARALKNEIKRFIALQDIVPVDSQSQGLLHQAQPNRLSHWSDSEHLYLDRFNGKPVLVIANPNAGASIAQKVSQLEALEPYGGLRVIAPTKLVDPKVRNGLPMDAVAVEDLRGANLLAVLTDLKIGRPAHVQITDAHIDALDALANRLDAGGHTLQDAFAWNFWVTEDAHRPLVPIDVDVSRTGGPSGAAFDLLTVRNALVEAKALAEQRLAQGQPATRLNWRMSDFVEAYENSLLSKTKFAIDKQGDWWIDQYGRPDRTFMASYTLAEDRLEIFGSSAKTTEALRDVYETLLERLALRGIYPGRIVVRLNAKSADYKQGVNAKANGAWAAAHTWTAQILGELGYPQVFAERSKRAATLTLLGNDYDVPYIIELTHGGRGLFNAHPNEVTSAHTILHLRHAAKSNTKRSQMMAPRSRDMPLVATVDSLLSAAPGSRPGMTGVSLKGAITLEELAALSWKHNRREFGVSMNNSGSYVVSGTEDVAVAWLVKDEGVGTSKTPIQVHTHPSGKPAQPSTDYDRTQVSAPFYPRSVVALDSMSPKGYQFGWYGPERKAIKGVESYAPPHLNGINIRYWPGKIRKNARNPVVTARLDELAGASAQKARDAIVWSIQLAQKKGAKALNIEATVPIEYRSGAYAGLWDAIDALKRLNLIVADQANAPIQVAYDPSTGNDQAALIHRWAVNGDVSDVLRLMEGE